MRFTRSPTSVNAKAPPLRAVGPSLFLLAVAHDSGTRGRRVLLLVGFSRVWRPCQERTVARAGRAGNGTIGRIVRTRVGVFLAGRCVGRPIFQFEKVRD